MNPLSKLFLPAFLLLFLSIPLLSQTTRSLTMKVLDEQIQQDNNRYLNLVTIENESRLVLEQTGTFQPVSIPVVVHLLYDTPGGNISDAQVLSQIQILNSAFDGTLGSQIKNWPQKAGDTNISFCLATKSPQGATTPGIIRVDTARRFWLEKEDFKFTSKGGSDIWPATDYLNIWVTDLGGRVSSYAQFPGGDPLTDGIVIDHRYFGNQGSVLPPFDQGLTLVKEVGHWLNLHNVFGVDPNNRDDFTSDTPKALPTASGCSAAAQSFGTPDMVENFMNATDDSCAAIFSEGQKNRMLVLLSGAGARAALRNSQGCQGPPPPPKFASSNDEKPIDVDQILDLEGVKLDVYPNPVRDHINVAVNKEGLSLSITNLQGQLLKQLTLQIGSTQISTSDFVPGAYVLTVYGTDGVRLVRKITVQR